MSANLQIRKVAVLGAGVMGAQIAAHLVNANVETLLFELPAKEGDPNGNVNKALDGLKKLEPAPISSPSQNHLHPAGQLRPASGKIARLRSDHRSHRRAHGLEVRPVPQGCAVRERATPSSPPTPPVCPSTSWPKPSPSNLRHRFCGIHFFNPPRYMHLVELIPCKGTEASLLDQLEDFPRFHAGQGRGARQGHTQLHRQPHRRILACSPPSITRQHSTSASTWWMR